MFKIEVIKMYPDFVLVWEASFKEVFGREQPNTR